MNTYKITIGKTTPKGKFLQLHEIIVNSLNTKNEVQSAFDHKYQGFSVQTEEVKEIEIFTKDEYYSDDKPKMIEKTKIKKNEFTESAEYSAIIERSDIEEWEEWIKPLTEKQKELSSLEKEFEKKIINKFNLKRIDNFKRHYNKVYFTFYNSWFDFVNRK